MQYVVKKSCSKRDKDKRQMQIKIFFKVYITKVKLSGSLPTKDIVFYEKTCYESRTKISLHFIFCCMVTFPFH